MFISLLLAILGEAGVKYCVLVESNTDQPEMKYDRAKMYLAGHRWRPENYFEPCIQYLITGPEGNSSFCFPENV